MFFSGLFQSHFGKERVLPIVRFGHISMMPDEPVQVELGKNYIAEINAYLIEAHSWGGHSGSPVYFLDYPIRHVGSITISSSDAELGYLLGLVSAHFDITKEVQHRGDIWGHSSVDINSGIAVVVPSQNIYELLMREGVVEMRRENNSDKRR